MKLFDIFELSKNYIWGKFAKAGFDDLELITQNYKIQYWDNKKTASNKQIVLLLHGFGARTEFQWYKQIEILSKKYRVIVPNLLCFGETQSITEGLFELQDQVDFVKTFINQLKIDTLQLVGISYGGLVGIEYTNQNQPKVSRLMLIDAPIKYYNNNDLQNVCQNYQLNSIYELFAPTDYFGLIKQFKAAYFGKQFIPHFVYKTLYKHLCQPNIANWKQLIIALNEKIAFYSEINYTIKSPIMLVWGQNDDIIPLRIGQELNNHLPNSQITVIPKTKHLPNLEKPKQFNKIMLDFLD